VGAVHYKTIHGIEYAYDVRSYWNKEEKKNKKETTYLGRVTDKKNGIYVKTREQAAAKKRSEKLILNFGDTYCIYQAFSQTEYFTVLSDVFKEYLDTLMCLVSYRIIRNSAMRYAENWFEGNYARILFKKADISSQRISSFLKILGDENLQRDFFTAYLSLLANKSVGTLIDSTGLPNEIDFPLNAWGHHGNSTESETRLLYVVDRATGMPVYFRYMPGNIVDVSTLSSTIAEMKQFGIDTDFAIVDAGYYSINNVRALYSARVNFLTRLPSNRKMFKELIIQHGREMEKSENVVIYGERVLFVRRMPVDLFGRPGFAYVVFDPKRYADESRKYLIAAKEDKKPDTEIDEGLKFKGRLIFISSFEIEESEIIPLYYTRQSVENIFGIMKNDLEILPLRVHSVETFRGYLLLNFIALLVRLSLQRQLNRKYTVEDVIYTTHNLMCKVYDKQIVVQELTKKCSDIFNLLHVRVVNSLGV
jgi:transposase